MLLCTEDSMLICPLVQSLTIMTSWVSSGFFCIACVFQMGGLRFFQKMSDFLIVILYFLHCFPFWLSFFFRFLCLSLVYDSSHVVTHGIQCKYYTHNRLFVIKICYIEILQITLARDLENRFKQTVNCKYHTFNLLFNIIYVLKYFSTLK